MEGAAYAIERLTSEEDLDLVAALEASTFTNPWTRDMLARELRDSAAARVYVLRTPALRVAAFCTCWVVAGELHINTLAVDVRYRRTGLATKLVEGLFADVAREGVTSATLEVRRSNRAALALYDRLGFSVEGIRPKYYVHPEDDALVLWKRDLGGAREC